MPIYQTTAYRYPNEQAILTGTMLAVLALIAISAVVTLTMAIIFVLVIVAFSYFSSRVHHNSIIRRAYRIGPHSPPDLLKLTKTCQARIQPGQVQIFVASNPQI